jgi:hypothetical protein
MAGGGVSYSLALNTPYLPGDALYGAQLASEQIWALAFNNDANSRVEILMELFNRRLDELELVLGTEFEMRALTAVDEAFTQLVNEIAALPEDQQAHYLTLLAKLTDRGQLLLAQIIQTEDSALLISHMQNRFGRFLILAQSEQPDLRNFLAETGMPVASNNGQPIPQTPEAIAALPDTFPFSLNAPRSVPFPPNADIATVHSFFPLIGGHDNLECTACHTRETFAGTSTQCVDCHLKDDAHNGQNGTNCASCHSITKWQDAVFDHATIGNQDCSACHTAPANHFPGACVNCHFDTTNFFNAIFNHNQIGNQDCSACHFAPPNHFEGECRACHVDTNNFRNASFNHSTIGSKDCSACHQPPKNHYEGACRDCHQDTNNFKNAGFNHSTIGNTDCSACHQPPANHYPGSCRNCHGDTNNFKNVNFSHAGLTDCQACHQPPKNHFPGQCSNCHNTNKWGDANFNHRFPLNHGGANGNCTSCHTDGGSAGTSNCFLCHDQQKIIKKHQDEGINDISNCVGCHPDGKD